MTTHDPAVGWPSSKVWLFGVVLLFVSAAAMRLIGAQDDFWLDEIWSLEFAGLAQSPIDILFSARIRHDNNHPLNTLWLYLLGDQDGWVAYRIPSVLAGLVTVMLAVVAGARRSRVEGLVAGLAFAISYMMIAYSTEARGYSLAVASALGAFVVCERSIERPSWRGAVGFGALVTVGFLAHFSFAHAYFGLFVWSAWRLVRSTPGWRIGAVRIAQLHAWPVAVAAFLYFVFVRDMHIGGGPTLTVIEVMSRTLAWTLGGPVNSGVAIALAAVAVATTLVNLVCLWRAGNDRWVFDLCAVIVAPLLTIVVLQPEFLVPRYFLLSITFFLLTFAHVVSRLFTVGRVGALAGALAVVLYVVGNAAHVVPFLRLGKGEYHAAVGYMAANTQGPNIDVAKIPDSNPMILRYYARRPIDGKVVRYIPHRSLQANAAEWLIVTWQLGQPEPPPQRRLRGLRYQLQSAFSYSAPSGIGWWLYRRV